MYLGFFLASRQNCLPSICRTDEIFVSNTRPWKHFMSIERDKFCFKAALFRIRQIYAAISCSERLEIGAPGIGLYDFVCSLHDGDTRTSDERQKWFFDNSENEDSFPRNIVNDAIDEGDSFFPTTRKNGAEFLVADGCHSSERFRIIKSSNFSQTKSKTELHFEQLTCIADCDSINESIARAGIALYPPSK